jgi:hypothetical protein
VLPAFTIMIGVLLLLAALAIDGVQSLGVSSNAETITWVTARRIANEGLSCAGRVGDYCTPSISQGAAETIAIDSASNWVTASGNPNLRLSTNIPATVSYSGGVVSVTLRFCYKPFLFGVFALSGGPMPGSDDAVANSPRCLPGEIEISPTRRAVSVVGS